MRSSETVWNPASRVFSTARFGLRWRVLPAEKLQVLAAEGLHTEADEIEAEGPPGRKFLDLHILGIDLQAHAGALSQIESAPHTLDDALDAFER